MVAVSAEMAPPPQGVRDLALWLAVRRQRSSAGSDDDEPPSGRVRPRREGDMLAASLELAKQNTASQAVRLWGTSAPIGPLPSLPRAVAGSAPAPEVVEPAKQVGDGQDKVRADATSGATLLPRELKAALLRATFEMTQLTSV